MKRSILCLALVAIAITSFCQQTTSSHTLTREEYFTKSKNQRNAAHILLIGGGVLIGTAFVIDGSSSDDQPFDNLGTIVIVSTAGVLAALGSIPLFIASSRNKKKAKAMTANFKMERIAPFQPQVLSYQSYPALSVRINL